MKMCTKHFLQNNNIAATCNRVSLKGLITSIKLVSKVGKHIDIHSRNIYDLEIDLYDTNNEVRESERSKTLKPE